MKKMLSSLVFSFWLSVSAFAFWSPLPTAYAQAALCNGNITLRWLDAAGQTVTSPAIGTTYRARVDFSQDPDCAGKVTASVTIFKDGASFATCNNLAVSTTDPAVLCEFTPSAAGVYTAKVKYNDLNGTLVERPVAGSSLVVPSAGGGGNGNTDGSTGGSGVMGVISNPIKFGSLGALIVGVIKFLISMIGALAVLFIIIGAARMVMSAGNESAVKAGKGTVTWAVLGLIVALLAFSIISLVQSVLGRN